MTFGKRTHGKNVTKVSSEINFDSHKSRARTFKVKSKGFFLMRRNNWIFRPIFLNRADGGEKTKMHKKAEDEGENLCQVIYL